MFSRCFILLVLLQLCFCISNYYTRCNPDEEAPRAASPQVIAVSTSAEGNRGAIKQPPRPPFYNREHAEVFGLDRLLKQKSNAANSPDRLQVLRKEFPPLAEAIEELRRIALQLRQTVELFRKADSAAQKVKYQAEIMELLKKEFDLEVRRQDLEIAYMLMRIEDLKTLLERFKKSEKAVLDHRLKNIMKGNPSPNRRKNLRPNMRLPYNFSGKE